MSFLWSKLLVFSHLLINFIFSNQLVEAQTLMDPDFDQSLLPFGSQPNNGGFIRNCGIRRGGGGGGGPTITVLNNCPYTVWPAAVSSNTRLLDTGRRLDAGEAWTLKLPFDRTNGRVWGRTNCSFDSSERGNCETGDCGGVLHCQGHGTPPQTLVEFSLNQPDNRDFLDISLVDGFNIPTKFSPKTSYGCSRGASCTADINQKCPTELRAPGGGCHNPCTVFKTDEYCCFTSSNCKPTNYSRFFKDLCPDAYSYPFDDVGSTLTCPGGTSYDLVFCPS